MDVIQGNYYETVNGKNQKGSSMFVTESLLQFRKINNVDHDLEREQGFFSKETEAKSHLSSNERWQ